tara:strand:+ start:4686 stop:5798 length:1113 start_codon:yes stop_codon:yes gene_type:complete
MPGGRWREKCVVHYDQAVTNFFFEHFQDKGRRCLIIGGAGFDPRSSEIVRCLSQVLGNRLQALMLKEERPDPGSELVRRANGNLELIRSYCTNLTVESLQIFAGDGAVIGGHNAIRVLKEFELSAFTDIVVDISALSLGISFPITSFIYQVAQKASADLNVHLTLLSNPTLDTAIHTEPNDVASRARGFGVPELYGEDEKAILWLPVLSENKQHVLRTIYARVKPHDTCPILPFPSEDPQKGDRIAYGVFKSIRSDFGGPLENEWSLEAQNFLYSDERRPLDIYRSILRIAEERERVFEVFGGSSIVLSPVGSKIPAIGALMAALECQFPVVYVEALAYTVDWAKVDSCAEAGSRMTHVWLYGNAYKSDF